MSEQKPLVNCHVHIFTGDHVPGLLAKSVLPWPTYFLFNLRWILRLIKWCRRHYRRFRYPSQRDKFAYGFMEFRLQLKLLGNKLLNIPGAPFIRTIVHVWLSVVVFFFIMQLADVENPFSKETSFQELLWSIWDYIFYSKWFLCFFAAWQKVITALILFSLIKPVRRLVMMGLKKIWSFLGSMPGKEFKALLSRYALIIRFSLYGSRGYKTRADRRKAKKKREELLKQGRKPKLRDSGQRFVYQKLRNQYPEGTQFVILPMDMEHMGAGNPAKNGYFLDQMYDILKLKHNKRYNQLLHPFVHVDPRRIEKDPNFLKWHLEGDKIVLDGTLTEEQLKSKDLPERGTYMNIKDYFDLGFCGVKIYPALGYYPFDKRYLPLWAYCAQEGIPIMTHCVVGTVYTRNRIPNAWNHHPVFKRFVDKDENGENVYDFIPLLERGGKAYQHNLTHPMNYLCLLEDAILKSWLSDTLKVDTSKSQEEQKLDLRIAELFGYDRNDKDKPLSRSLRNLKVCLAHYGGKEEWFRHLESDTSQYNQDVMKHQDEGLYDGDSIVVEADQRVKWTVLYEHWKSADWYTVISSLMMKYPNMYADISYIIHEEKIRPLLNQTLDHPVRLDENNQPMFSLRDKVLFGTDFYVVRNHNSDKELLANIREGLSAHHFDMIARDNPHNYLSWNSKKEVPEVVEDDD